MVRVQRRNKKIESKLTDKSKQKSDQIKQRLENKFFDLYSEKDIFKPRHSLFIHDLTAPAHDNYFGPISLGSHFDKAGRALFHQKVTTKATLIIYNSNVQYCATLVPLSFIKI